MMAETRGKHSTTRAWRGAETSSARGVTIGPLFATKGPDDLAKNVFRLCYCLGVKCSDILQISVNTLESFATVTVRSEECESYLVAIFQDPAAVMNQFDLRRITVDPRKLSAVRISEQAASGIQEAQIAANPKTKVLGDDGSSKGETSSRRPTSEGPPYKTDAKQPLKVPGSRKRDHETAQIKTPKQPSKATKSSTNTQLPDSQGSFELLESESECAPKKAPHTCVSAATSTVENRLISRDKKESKKTKKEAIASSKSLHATRVADKKKSVPPSRCHSGTVGKRKFQYKTLSSPHDENKDKNYWQSSVKPKNLNHSKGSKGELSEPRKTTAAEPAPGAAISRQPLAGPSSSSNAPNSQAASPSDDAPDAVVKLHAKTSTPAVPACGCPETVFYHLHQHVGAETRHAEFKRGGIIHDQRLFRAVVGRYVCGFLNSEGGTLYFGVTDDGKVKGIRVDAAMEETLRFDVDFAVRSLLEPSVDPSEYSVNFASVMRPQGLLSQDLRVMEVCVKPRRPPRRRHFACGNVVYLRRDGSLQALSRDGRTARR